MVYNAQRIFYPNLELPLRRLWSERFPPPEILNIDRSQLGDILYSLKALIVIGICSTCYLSCMRHLFHSSGTCIDIVYVRANCGNVSTLFIKYTSWWYACERSSFVKYFAHLAQNVYHSRLVLGGIISCIHGWYWVVLYHAFTVGITHYDISTVWLKTFC